MTRRTFATLCLVAVTAAAAPALGVRWNASASMPVGLWQFSAPQDPPRRGQVVGLCLPPDWAKIVLSRGYTEGGGCTEGHEPLLKPVAAIEGDVVSVSVEGIRVNGELVVPPALTQDAAGRPLTAIRPGVYPVAAQTVWVLSNHDPRSLDSRYFGPLPASAIVAEARPVLVGR